MQVLFHLRLSRLNHPSRIRKKYSTYLLQILMAALIGVQLPLNIEKVHRSIAL
jgi:hypothetical protein